MIRFFHWLFVVILILVGCSLVLAGGYLLYLEGSSYYLLSGLLLLYIATMQIKGQPIAAKSVWCVSNFDTRVDGL